MMMAILMAASSFPIASLITNELPPAVLMFFRFLLAASFFAPLVFIKHGVALPKIADLLRYTMLTMPSVGFFWCMFESLKYTSVIICQEI
ncbi:hypothetical protein tinsulaeT_36710 [Thalassotalea insulae]|uniref:EamA domain-containing protein n=1 Tax=Thalassotalea insulae TaxID=2056778 RepID=A0ABQ6H1N2_9GAMM|nr:hypothetical protein tinsulaeT_36710 [Thalassotalea insulae]